MRLCPYMLLMALKMEKTKITPEILTKCFCCATKEDPGTGNVNEQKASSREKNGN